MALESEYEIEPVGVGTPANAFQMTRSSEYRRAIKRPTSPVMLSCTAPPGNMAVLVSAKRPGLRTLEDALDG